MSNWEGGVQVNTWASGGFIPALQCQTKKTRLIAGWDWYATYCALAGVDPTDEKAAKANLPPIDSLNMWPYLSGQVLYEGFGWCKGLVKKVSDNIITITFEGKPDRTLDWKKYHWRWA